MCTISQLLSMRQVKKIEEENKLKIKKNLCRLMEAFFLHHTTFPSSYFSYFIPFFMGYLTLHFVRSSFRFCCYSVSSWDQFFIIHFFPLVNSHISHRTFFLCTYFKTHIFKLCAMNVIFFYTCY